MAAGIRRQVRPQVLQLRFLLIPREGHAALLPQGDALFERRVGERTATPQDSFKLALLGGRRPERLLLGFAHARLTHGYCSPVCFSAYARSVRTISPFSARSCCVASRRSSSAIAAGRRLVLLLGAGCSLMHLLYHQNRCITSGRTSGASHGRLTAWVTTLRLAAGYSPFLSKSYCVYDAPSPEAIRHAARRNNLPVDKITQVQVLDPYFYR
jgi:Protein of unknown function (DUF4242)